MTEKIEDKAYDLEDRLIDFAVRILFGWQVHYLSPAQEL